MRSASLALTSLLLLAGPLAAQEIAPVGAPRNYLGVNLGAAQPTGAFGDSVDTGFAIDLNYLYRVDQAGVLGLRLDGGFMIYGSEQRRVLLSPTVGGRINVDLNTSNNVFYLGAGPQLMLRTGVVHPYVNAQGGLAYFSTTSSLSGRGGESFASTNNFDDWALTYGGGAGVYIPVNRGGRTPIALDLGVRYRHTGEVDYLREGSIRDLPNGTIDFSPIRSDTDVFDFAVGVSVGIVPKKKGER